ncbi:MAG: DUF839 domain-containing protein, partial [Actinobacteria bacterium]|nr:DUF839 domain-containing protein [Actinomycetota bacterium]
GFRSRVIAVGGELVGSTGYAWHPYPDGGGVFPLRRGGWIYASNSEVPWPGAGGASAIRFDRDGEIVAAYRILSGTTLNCAGGMTPWGTWLSCEETQDGRVWECDVRGRRQTVDRPAMGIFAHEAAGVDPVRRCVYMTEDAFTGLLYRFVPDQWPLLASGTLEAAAVDGTQVSWVPVTDPSATGGPARDSAPGATRFAGGEGLFLSGDLLYFVTKWDSHVHRLDLATSTLSTLWDGAPPLVGSDNITVHAPTGDVYVCEDTGDMQIAAITPEGQAAPFLQVLDHPDSEMVGVAFDPVGGRMYFSSQRAPTPKTLPDVVPNTTDDRGIGVTYEVTGPFVTAPPTPPTTTSTTRRRA